ncbi:MAG: U32 family peptidase [bacterium]|nr:U32 family peptidase [bacterium]
MTKISTFASNEDQIKTALKAGADHLILEDNTLSIRCQDEPSESPGAKRLNQLATLARSINAKVTLSANIDMMVHHHHIDAISNALSILTEGSITAIRIQDPGLIPFITQYFPSFDIHLSTETSNNNIRSNKYYASLGVSLQCLSNEYPVDGIIQAQKECQTPLEIQVQGPLLIQYSLRRYMSFSQQIPQQSSLIKKWAEDTDLPGRYFSFLETPHGHFMFAQFDRCLALHHPQLSSLNLQSWLIDARGESLEYLANSITLYKTIRSGGTINVAQDTQHLSQLSKRPQKAGFFIANKTDSDWRNFKHHADDELLGRVIDAKRGKYMLVDVVRTFSSQNKIELITPEGKQIHVTPHPITNIDGNAISDAVPLSQILLPWAKGTVVGSRLVLSNQNP